ncbi:hypothetical protein I5H08_gp015 [Mycobacterium phage Yuna]|uniref:Uncharacterized protein n=1 Tax=Mycobacterium phage Yuna TaxID=2599885 RepID=A0A5J6TL66_9CAUD|nr:hypothetical protein I5H08_gp015 [Mycobacterium phage Yuna]QFG09472.1 hypothetical protein PBI_YUNA_90 [Mycobacterium phage Yuna]
MSDLFDMSAWYGGRSIRTRAKYTHTFPFLFPWGGAPTRTTAIERMRQRDRVEPYVEVFRLVWGIDVRPARPTAREAWQDLLDALAALVLIVGAAVRELAVRAVAWLRGVAEDVAEVFVWSWAEPLIDGVLDRWDALRAPYTWGRRVGPLVRFWDADMVYVGSMGRDVEPVAVWLRRVAAHVWQAVRHG